MSETSQPQEQFSNIQYFSGERRRALPTWARFWLSLGARLGSRSEDEEPIVVAVAVPTRAFVAPLVATGTVLARVGSVDPWESEHLRAVIALDAGSPILLRSGSRKLKGEFEGVIEFEDLADISGPKIVVRTDDSTQRFIDPVDAARIEILDLEEMNLPKSQKGRKIIPPGPLAQSILGDQIADRLTRRTQLDCVLIAPTSGIAREECSSKAFAVVDNEGEVFRGALQEVIRARGLLQKGAAFRTVLISAGSSQVQNASAILDPFVTIFDGARGYIRWNQFWSDRNNFIVVDRTERDFNYSVELLNKRFIERRVGDEMDLGLSDLPPGVELMAFEVSQ